MSSALPPAVITRIDIPAVKAAVKVHNEVVRSCTPCILLRSLEQVILDAMLFAHDQQLAGYPATAEEDEAAAADEQLPWWGASALIWF